MSGLQEILIFASKNVKGAFELYDYLPARQLIIVRGISPSDFFFTLYSQKQRGRGAGYPPAARRSVCYSTLYFFQHFITAILASSQCQDLQNRPLGD